MREDQIVVGGQAVIEGVMMRAPHSYAVAVRKPNGEIVSKSELLPALSVKYPILKLPVLRGSAVLIQSMVLGIKALNFSANVAFHESDSSEDPKAERLPVVTAGPSALASVAVAVETKPAVTTTTKARKTTAAVRWARLIFAILFNVLCLSCCRCC